MAAKASPPMAPDTSSAAAAASPPSNFRCVKELAHSPDIRALPSTHLYSPIPYESCNLDPDDSVPLIDFSLLSSASNHPDGRSKVVRELRKACQDWGFFMLVNHGMPEAVMQGMLNASHEFFELPEEEKSEMNGKHFLAPIRYGTSFNAAKDKVFLWRDFLKLIVHPQFNCPPKPKIFRDLLMEFTNRTRELAMELLECLSESLGLRDKYVKEALGLESAFQIFAINYYPHCPQPELAMGLPPHSDHGLLTFLIDNGVDGLQVQRKGKWVNVKRLPNTILINVGDHLEIFSNGKFKSILHRAVVNSEVTRISLGVVVAPSLETIVGPAQELLEAENCPPAYVPMQYKTYLEQQQTHQLKDKSVLERLKCKPNSEYVNI